MRLYRNKNLQCTSVKLAMYPKNQVPIHLKPDLELTERSVRRCQVYQLYYLYIRADIHHYGSEDTTTV